MPSHFDHEARIAMMQAHDEARELGHSEVGPDHVLLGLLADVRGDAYAVLTRHGLQYAAARDVVIHEHDSRPAPEPADDPDSAEHDPADDLDRDREALAAIGIDLDRLRTSVRERFGEDLTEGWGERRPRGPRGRRRGPGSQGFGPDGRGGPGFGPGGPGRGRRGPRSGRFGDERFSPELRDVLRDLVHELRADAPGDGGERGGRGERGERGERRRGPRGRPLSADRLLQSVLRSEHPAVTAVLATADDPAALRAEVDQLVAHAGA